MSAPTITTHLAGYDLDPALPLSQQATSLAAELEACRVFQDAARRDVIAGDIRGMARIVALNDHERQLREALERIKITEQRH